MLCFAMYKSLKSLLSSECSFLLKLLVQSSTLCSSGAYAVDWQTVISWNFFFFNHVFTSMPQWKLQCAIQVTVVVSYPLYLKRLLSAINSLGLLTKQLVVGLPYRLYRERIPNPKSCLDWRQTEGEGVRGEGRCKGQVFNIRGSLQSTTTGV